MRKKPRNCPHCGMLRSPSETLVCAVCANDRAAEEEEDQVSVMDAVKVRCEMDGEHRYKPLYEEATRHYRSQATGVVEDTSEKVFKGLYCEKCGVRIAEKECDAEGK